MHERSLSCSALKERLLYSPRKGVFYWIKPSQAHAELLGEEAGFPSSEKYGKAYHIITIDGVKYKRGRLAFLYMEGRFPNQCIDHINGNGLDDRWENLREASVLENAWNRKTCHKKNSHLPMGVRVTGSGRFAARIAVRKRQIQIGTFDTAEAASSAYQKAREKYFGQFA